MRIVGKNISNRLLGAITLVLTLAVLVGCQGLGSKQSTQTVQPGGLTTSPASVSFGSVQVGDAVSQNETLTNSGGSAVTVTALTLPTATFSDTGLNLPLTLQPNQSSTFSIGFTPTAAGATGGSLVLTVDGLSSPVSISLSGTGVVAGSLTATPTSLSFTNINVGQSSSQTLTLQNVGGVTAQISQITASGTGFSISGVSPPVTLTSGQSASFNVTFAPESTGSFSGSVLVASNAQNQSLSITLNGQAVSASQPTLGVSSTVNVGNVDVGSNGTQTGVLTANGANVVVSSVSLGGTDPSEFSISGLSFPVTVTPTQSVSFTVTFTPGATGAASATASFSSNASDSTAVASLAGTGITAPQHSVDLSWTGSTGSDITSYNIYRATFETNTCGSYANIGSTGGSTTSYTDNAVTAGASYCYAATAVNADGESGYSNIAEATVPSP